MHATHQFFLTKRSVYVLVLDARQGEIEGNIHYWLQTIQSFGGDSPVLVVTNKCDVQPLSLNKQRFIVEMMRKFELCFDFPDQPGTLLVPELLTKNEPDVNWKSASECLNFEYAYGVLPSGLIPRFIVRMHHALTDRPTYWRSGVVLAIDGCKVLVRGDSRAQTIRISVDGSVEARRGALATVRNQLKAIHATIPKLEVKEQVPLPDFPSVAVPYTYLLVKGLHAWPRRRGPRQDAGASGGKPQEAA
jgi:internalin A